ncbi:hypothetical protein MAXJ12_24587 [Mesorhizobium alhagi CCNWXJ12-2]|uniref:Uncharacterized protein n=2 Tax=Allomesorhizobium alhagi TaxID=475067 RepID=H0HXJ4_9HYPH|nr:hypothetical protein MAXJ12_24587 [Mesorhizobium alhagi CCNWXJ12-2]
MRYLSCRAKSLIVDNVVVGGPYRSIGSLLFTFSALSSTASNGIALRAIYSTGLGVPVLPSESFTESLAKGKGMKRARRVLQIAAGARMMIVKDVAMITGTMRSPPGWSYKSAFSEKSRDADAVAPSSGLPVDSVALDLLIKPQPSQQIPFGLATLTLAALPYASSMPFRAKALVEVTSTRMTAAGLLPLRLALPWTRPPSCERYTSLMEL